MGLIILLHKLLNLWRDNSPGINHTDFYPTSLVSDQFSGLQDSWNHKGIIKSINIKKVEDNNKIWLSAVTGHARCRCQITPRSKSISSSLLLKKEERSIVEFSRRTEANWTELISEDHLLYMYVEKKCVPILCKSDVYYHNACKLFTWLKALNSIIKFDIADITCDIACDICSRWVHSVCVLLTHDHYRKHGQAQIHAYRIYNVKINHLQEIGFHFKIPTVYDLQKNWSL